MECWLFAIFLEAQTQYIVEPFVPQRVSLEVHTHTIREWVTALYAYRLEHA